MKKLNPAQIITGWVWSEKGELPKKVFTGSIEDGFKVDQQVLIEYLMEFQQWLYEKQPKEVTE